MLDVPATAENSAARGRTHPARRGRRSLSRARPLLLWGALLAVLGVLLASREYQTRDPDSVVYATIAARMAAAPVERWIAPDWPGGFYMDGPFREHPVGLFVPAAALGRLGYAPEQAAYLVNAVYQVGTLLTVPLLAAAWASEERSRRLAWLLQLLPLAFVYRVRANHEGALVFFFALALLGTERARERPAWALLTALALDGILLVKGLTVVPALLCCLAWLAASHRAGRRLGGGWLGPVLSVFVLGATVWAYEAAYVQVTGTSFLEYYLGRATRADPNPASAVSDTLYNLVWYGARVAWFAAPWSVAGAVAALGLRREASAAGRGGVLFAVLAVVLYVGMFSLGERRAERYIYPAYVVTGAAGALLAMARWPRLDRALARWDGPWTALVVFVLTTGLHLMGGWLQLPRIKLWKADA